MKLLPKDLLIRTGPVDHADWNYRPVLSFVMRRRFALVRSLLPRKRAHRLLEIGFGSGIFMPELARYCDELYGIDIHDEAPQVQARLEDFGVHATLSKQTAVQLDFKDGFFDTVVAISALEFVDGIDRAASELARVISPQGRLIAVMPGTSPLLDLALRLATGESARNDYGDRRERVVPALSKYFRIVRKKSFPPIYTAYQFALSSANAPLSNPKEALV